MDAECTTGGRSDSVKSESSQKYSADHANTACLRAGRGADARPQRVLIRNVRHSPPATLNLDRTSRVTIAADNDSAIEFLSDVIRRAVAARAVATLVGLDVGTLSLFLTDALRAAGSGERGLVLAAKGPMRGETCPGSTHPAPRTPILEM